MTVEDIYQRTKIDRWFLHEIRELIRVEDELRACPGLDKATPELILRAKQHGFADIQLAALWNSNPTDVKNGSVAESFKLLRPWIRSCHINTLYTDAAGVYPYRELFALLKGIGYDRATLIEVGPSCPDANFGAELLRYYKALWLELCR